MVTGFKLFNLLKFFLSSSLSSLWTWPISVNVTVIQSAQQTSTDRQHYGCPPTTMPRHTIEEMLTASNIDKIQCSCQKTSEAITDQHSSNSLSEQCSLNIHGYGDGTTRRHTGFSSAKYQINTYYNACS